MEPIELISGYYKVSEAADILRMSKLSVYRAVSEGRLRAVRIGGQHGQIRISPEALRRYARPVVVETNEAA